MSVSAATMPAAPPGAAARTGGGKNYFVEMDLDLMKASIPYLHELKA